MFTGIVEEVGTIRALRRDGASARLTVEAPRVSEGTEIGDSIAVSGVCLTVVERQGSRLSFDAVPETVRRSILQAVRVGDGVNLERALAVGQRLGGHFVQGHVDGLGALLDITPQENAHILRVGAAPNLLRYMVPKGSVALDGISLTVVDVGPDSFTVWIIPHTYQRTTLHQRKTGDRLNIETDLLAKYVERLLAARGDLPGLTAERLTAAGFMTSGG